MPPLRPAAMPTTGCPAPPTASADDLAGTCQPFSDLLDDPWWDQPVADGGSQFPLRPDETARGWTVLRPYGDIRSDDRLVDAAQWWHDRYELTMENAASPEQVAAGMDALGPLPQPGEWRLVDGRGRRIQFLSAAGGSSSLDE